MLGNLKPSLTPARTIPTSCYRDPKWIRLKSLVYIARGKLWEKLVQHIDSNLDKKTFWELALIYDAPLNWMSSGIIWSQLPIPIIHDSDNYEFKNISSSYFRNLKLVEYTVNDEDMHYIKTYKLTTESGADIQIPNDLLKWVYKYWRYALVHEDLALILITISNITLKDGALCLNIQEPSNPSKVPGEYQAVCRYFCNLVACMALLIYRVITI